MNRTQFVWTLTLLLLLSPVLWAKNMKKPVVLHLYGTTDIHGNFFSYDFMTDRNMDGGLARISTYLTQQREKYGKQNCLLLDNGDILQGQPCVYYSNFVDTSSPLLASEVMNYLGCDVATFGNHDIEAGRKVFTRWQKDAKFPILGANILNASDKSNYAKPYVVFERQGIKIAVLGLITPAIPMWVPEKLWKGLYFEDIIQSAKKWVPVIEKREKPDVLVGVFHTGWGGGSLNGYNENAAKAIATEVPGFNLIFFGHDHRPNLQTIKNKAGKDVCLLNAGPRGFKVSEATVTCMPQKFGKYSVSVNGQLVDMKNYPMDEAYLDHFKTYFNNTKNFVHQDIGAADKPVNCIDTFFGPSIVADLMHNAQFENTDADISLISPLTTTQVIPAGKLYVKDIFTIYPYENMIDVLRMSGQEIKNSLEASYDLWINTMHSPDDHLIRMRQVSNGKYDLKNFCSYMVQAAGIMYEVDVTKEKDNRIHILKMSDGRPFDLSRDYKVAINSYLGCGGGSILTTGGGISLKELPKRILSTSTLDLRHYIIEYVKSLDGKWAVQPRADWRFVPEAMVRHAIQVDRTLLLK